MDWMLWQKNLQITFLYSTDSVSEVFTYVPASFVSFTNFRGQAKRGQPIAINYKVCGDVELKVKAIQCIY